MWRWLLTIIIILVVQSIVAITGSNPTTGACLCVDDGSAVDVRSTACGTIVDQVNSSRCFKYDGEKLICNLNGTTHKFYKLQHGSGSGWIAGRYLKLGKLSQCQSHQRSAQGDGCPRIVSRSEWGASAPKSGTELVLPVPKVFIHHTKSASCTTQEDCSRLVKEFQTRHQNDMGWDDIGYNFLVGEDGNAYEGRGWDLMGAHASAKWNYASLGIAVIGNFMYAPPQSAALNTLKQLIECGVTKGKISDSYALRGHRDGCATKCPGTALGYTTSLEHGRIMAEDFLVVADGVSNDELKPYSMSAAAAKGSVDLVLDVATG